MIRQPLSVQTTYQDLLDALQLRAVSHLAGETFIREIGNRAYRYATQRIGNTVTQIYIGPDSPDLRRRIEQAKRTVGEPKDFQRNCTSMVAQLRAAGVLALDQQSGKILTALQRAGTFRLGGTLIGTHAFRMYSAELGFNFGASVGMTQDIDIAAFENIKLVIDDQVDPSLAETFKYLQLTAAPTIDPKQCPTRWQMPGGRALIDFLTPRMQSRQEVVKLAPLGVWAQTLSFLNYLIADPIPAVGLYRSGVLVQIPRPERYAVHKLIVAQRRQAGPNPAKARKDLAQAQLLIEVLAEDRPEALAIAYDDAVQRGDEWRTLIAKSAKQRPEIAEMLAGLSLV